MMKFLNKFSLAILLSGGVSTALAGGFDISGLLPAWGNPSMNKCQSAASFETCVGGDRLSDCANWRNKDPKQNRGTHDDEGATLMLVATNVVENGGYFCVIQLQGRNKNEGNAWTEYFNPGSDTDCLWLCKEGFYGQGCASSGTSTRCDSRIINADAFSKYKRVTNKSAPNIEESIPMFFMNENSGCGVHKNQEHDMILAVSRWTPSGHGVFAQPTVFRAERSGWGHMVSTATIYFAGTPTLLCMEGYQPNSGRTDCDPTDATKCALNNMCTGWSDFNAVTHEIKAAQTGDCNEYRCKQPGYGFKSTSDKTCIACGDDARHGANADNGVCIACEIGNLFSNGGCVPASATLGNSMLAFGPGGTNAPLKDQCWTLIEPSEYKKCVIGESEKPSRLNLPGRVTTDPKGPGKEYNPNGSNGTSNSTSGSSGNTGGGSTG